VKRKSRPEETSLNRKDPPKLYIQSHQQVLLEKFEPSFLLPLSFASHFFSLLTRSAEHLIIITAEDACLSKNALLHQGVSVTDITSIYQRKPFSISLRNSKGSLFRNVPLFVVYYIEGLSTLFSSTHHHL
jgi:hypothetical protein